MIKTPARFLLLLCFAASVAAAIDPAAAVAQARSHVFEKKYVLALQDLNGALDAAQQLAETERKQALPAIHFYMAAALAGLHNDAEARSHIEQFIELSPNARLSAPEKYDPHFVALFNDVRNPKGEHPEFRFENFYPGFNGFVAPKVNLEEPAVFGSSPALFILGSKKEKQQWEADQTTSERETFVRDFWKRRDPTPDTAENEFRDTFNLRAAFADRAFTHESGVRGSMTDRGKIFVLLGVPSGVRRRPLTQRDTVVIYEPDTVINGLIEEWVYGREQLPMKIVKNSVSYRFVTQKGIGDGVLQREEMYAFQAMMIAMNPNEQNK